VTGHDANHVEDVGDAYVLVCGCGWRSSASGTAVAIGQEWDQHRRAASDGN
jgi:hypothetical protein